LQMVFFLLPHTVGLLAVVRQTKLGIHLQTSTLCVWELGDVCACASVRVWSVGVMAGADLALLGLTDRLARSVFTSYAALASVSKLQSD